MFLKSYACFFAPPLPASRDPLAQFDVEKREHEMKMKKMEQEMEEVFEMKVQEKLQKLRDIEADVSPKPHPIT